jgi:hypothetical protein
MELTATKTIDQFYVSARKNPVYWTREPSTVNVIGVLSAGHNGGLFAMTPCGREYRVTPSEKADIEKGTHTMLSLWCSWARGYIARQGM